MSQFHQFDISDFLDEIKEPLFLMDYDEIVFFNSFFQKNFPPISDDWRLFFESSALVRELDEFFSTGLPPTTRIDQKQFLVDGSVVNFEWTFINLPSSYNSRFLIAKGHLVRNEEVEKQAIPLNQDFSSAHSLDFIQSILNNSHDLIAILDREGNYKFVSDTVRRKLGYAADTILGKNYQKFIEEGLIESVKGSFAQVLETTDEVPVDFWVKAANGKKIYLESFAKNLLNHPLIQGVIVSSRDITDFILSENSLQKRYDIENLILQVSSRLINGKFQELDTEFFMAISKFGDFLNAKNAEILVFNGELDQIEVMTSWTAGRDEPWNFVLSKEELHLIFENQTFLKNGKVRLITLDLPENHAIKVVSNSRIFIPMTSGNSLLGLIRFESDTPVFSYVEKEIQVLRQFGDVLAGAYLGSQMSQKMERNESLLAHTEVISKSGSWKFSLHKKRFSFSDGLATLFDLESKTYIERFSFLIYKLDKPFRAEFIKNLKLSGSTLCRTAGEFTITDKLGKVRFIRYEIEGKREFLTKSLEVYGFCTDISHERATESYLRLQSQILAQVSDPILVTNLVYDVIYQNEAAVQMCSADNSRDLEGSFGDLLTVQWEQSENLKSVSSNLKLGEVWKSERNIRAGNSESLPFEISIQAIHAHGKEKIGYSIILRGLEERYRTEQIAKSAQLIVENSPAVLFRVDPNDGYRIHYISENIKRFGYEAAFLIKNQTSFLDLLHPDDSEAIKTKSKNATIDVGVPAFSGEYRIKTATGDIVWVEDNTRDVVSESGKIVLHEGLFQDISDRKNFEEIQSERDKQYRVLAANIPDTNIFLVDAERNYILAEGTNFEKWGLTREDFEGKKLRDLQLTNYENASDIVDRVYNNREVVETEFVLNNRQYKTEVRPIIIQDSVKYVMSVVRDVQEEHQAKLDLQRSEEKFRRLVEESTEIIFSLTETFLLHYVSPNVTQFLGYSSAEVTGRSIFDFLHPDDLGVFRVMLGETENFLAQNQFLEYRLLHKNGEYRVFNSNGKLIQDKTGIYRYYTGVARDISKLKETQRELLLAKEKAELASQIKSQFLSVMSHEIRTPMNAVIGLAHFLMEEDPRPDQLENLKTLQFSAENLMALINDILDFNKIDSKKVVLEHKPFDLKNSIRRIIHAHSFQANEKALHVYSEIDDSIPDRLIGDSLRIGQIVNNLISNAIKFTEKGFVKISVSREFTHGNLTDLRFVFEDTGIGIPLSKRDSIFEAFTQASSSTSRKYGGTGLGLAIVKRLVELFGGEIELRPRKAGGSIFEFTIPLEFVDLQKIKSDKAELAFNQQSLENSTILVAEDNTVNQILIRKFLTKWNVGKLVIASNGLEALEQFELERFDLVLLDLQMPELDGFGVAEAIRRHADSEKQHVPILALTAASISEVRERLKSSGIDDFIPKPFTPEFLFEKILEYLKTKDLGNNGV